MSLQVLITADPELPVPPPLYGGIERIIATLVDGLVARGHRVTLVAHAASTTSCEVIPYSSRVGRSTAGAAEQAALIARATASRRPDVVQSFSRLAALLPILPMQVPKVMSYQRAITPGSVRWGRRLAGETLTFTACSAQMTGAVRTLAPWRIIHNGVPMDAFTPAASVPADAPLMFLGRIEPIKGTHVAIEVARRADRPLVIAGTVASEHRAYFDRAIAPSVDGDRVRYVGPVDDRAKNDWLGRCAALVMPIQWDEPFGIVMAEALACGTPVVAFERGAVPEVVDNGVTGFVCGDVAGMIAAVGRLHTIDRQACRAAAEARFSARSLVDAYEALYFELHDARARGAQQPAMPGTAPRAS